MTGFGRVLRNGLLGRARAAIFGASRPYGEHPSRVTITRASSRPMTDADWEHFDTAFAKMNEAFAELRKIK